MPYEVGGVSDKHTTGKPPPGKDQPAEGMLYLTRHRDPTQWFRAAFAGTLACIVLLTLFGLVLVSSHGKHLSTQMQLLASFGMEPLIDPNDLHLSSFRHLLGSALFFGCSLGVLNAMVAMVLSIPVWIKGRFSLMDALTVPALGGLCAYLGFSGEFPLLSVAVGFASPVVFFVPWALVICRSRPRQVYPWRWLGLSITAALPFVFMLVLGSSSFSLIRDSMLMTPAFSRLSDFYYDHTLLAAHVIKPVAALEQKVIAVSPDIGRIGPMPHGSLWVRTPGPCDLKGRDLVVSTGRLACKSIVIEDGRPANDSNRILGELSKEFDQNAKMRRGIGIFFYRGPLLAVPILFMLWFALFVSNVSVRSKAAAAVIVLAYLALFYPPWKSIYQRHLLVLEPEIIAQYILSEDEEKRYLALMTYPQEFTPGELIRFAHDESPRIRLHALAEAGTRADPRFLGVIEEALSDPQLNVRTRACWALGRTPSERSADLLEQAFLHDPSWYVRSYAYRALGKERPQAKVAVFPGSPGEPSSP